MFIPKGSNSLPFIIDFTYLGVAYSAVHYSLHTVVDRFKTKLNDNSNLL